MSQQVNPFNDDLAVIQKLDDEPNDVDGLSAQQLKEKFDQAPLAIQKYINEVLVRAHNALDNGLDELARQLANHVDVDPNALTAANVSIAAALAEQYGLTSLVPNVHEALEKLGPIGKDATELAKLVGQADYLSTRDTFLRDETAALFGLGSEAVPDDVLMAIGNSFSRIVSGTVTGSSIASEDSPNSITFPFEPKLVIVTDDYRNAYGDYSTMQFGWFFWVPGVEKDRVGNYGYGRGYRYYKQDGNTLSWWVEQGKTEDTTYAAAVVGPYVAFG